MKIIITIILFTLSYCVLAQDTIGMKKKNYFVFNADYLYNQHFGNRTVEITYDRPSSSNTDTSYYRITIENTSGFLASTSYRKYLSNHFLVQFGINFRNTKSSFLHNDSVVNENKSHIIREKHLYNRIGSPVYCGFQFKSICFLTGVIVPITTFNYTKRNYEDGTVSKSKMYLTNSIWTDFYLSEKIQLDLFKKPNIGISIGADLNPEIFSKYRNGYLIHWNAGIVWMLEKKKYVKPLDYVM